MKSSNKDRKSPEDWTLTQPFSAKTIGVLLVLLIAMSFSAKNVEIDKLFGMSGEWIASFFTEEKESQMGKGINGFLAELFPPQISDSIETSRIQDLDREQLPFLSRIEMKEVKDYALDPETYEMKETVTEEEYLVKPLGYLQIVAIKMLETLEIGLWGTVIAIVISIPLAIFSARNYANNRVVYTTARAIVSFLRAIPELISALILVIAFGFGPIPGILALGLHCAGFLGKFYAEDIENADKGPQDALFAIGAGKLKVLWLSVLPQVFPQYVAYTLYILDRNVRMAAVVGIVGAGGIGLELKGRFEMFHYAHVGTILIVLFITVLILDQFSARIRKKIIA